MSHQVEHFVFPCHTKRHPKCHPKPEKRPFSPLSEAPKTQKRLAHCSNQCSSRSNTNKSAFYPFKPSSYPSKPSSYPFKPSSYPFKPSSYPFKPSLFLLLLRPDSSYQLSLLDHSLFIEYNASISQSGVQQRAFLYTHLFLCQNRINRRY